MPSSSPHGFAVLDSYDTPPTTQPHAQQEGDTRMEESSISTRCIKFTVFVQYANHLDLYRRLHMSTRSVHGVRNGCYQGA
mmetsp:Transcript_17311/g.32835  ORF Transcript_17311/g.32835 Transcript_17311/m.32835 type:complete len:80 (+) Transcript_17311:49-288(+)